MILVGNQRGGAKDLSNHLMKDENDHVTVHEVRGFASNDLGEALQEAYAISRGTKCKQFLFSLSLNPPKDAEVSTDYFEQTIERAERDLGLDGQPRAIVFHEKEGRRHAHAVWSRINIDEMKAVQLSFTKRKMQKLARDLYLENGWKMPDGLAKGSKRDPRNFSLAEWQQAKRVGKDPRTIKTAFQDAWAISDSKVAFTHALEERGYRLARGDRRGFVALDYQGEVYSIPRQAGVKTKLVRDRLGDEAELPSVSDMRAQIANDMLSKAQRLQKELDDKAQRRKEQFERHRMQLVKKQRDERTNLNSKLAARSLEETKDRQSRFRPGMRGLWDKLNGGHKRIQKQNEYEALQSMLRDRAQQDRLIVDQQNERRRLSHMQVRDADKRAQVRKDIRKDQKVFRDTIKAETVAPPPPDKSRDEKKEEFKRKRRSKRPSNRPRRPRGPSPGR